MFWTLFFTLFFSPCADESSQNCVWYAQVQGNGQGESYLDLFGTTHYLEGKKK